MKTETAIKTLIKARNEKYNSELLHINVSEERSWSNKKVLTITGHYAAVYFCAMDNFLCPMIASYIEVIDSNTVKIELN